MDSVLKLMMMACSVLHQPLRMRGKDEDEFFFFFEKVVAYPPRPSSIAYWLYS